MDFSKHQQNRENFILLVNSRYYVPPFTCKPSNCVIPLKICTHFFAVKVGKKGGMMAIF